MIKITLNFHIQFTQSKLPCSHKHTSVYGSKYMHIHNILRLFTLLRIQFIWVNLLMLPLHLHPNNGSFIVHRLFNIQSKLARFWSKRKVEKRNMNSRFGQQWGAKQTATQIPIHTENAKRIFNFILLRVAFLLIQFEKSPRSIVFLTSLPQRGKLFLSLNLDWSNN